MRPASILLAALALGTTSSMAAGTPQGTVADPLPAWAANPILAQFSAICSQALRDADESFALVDATDWRKARSGDWPAELFTKGDPVNGGFELTIVRASGSVRAQACQISGLYVSPRFSAYFDQFGYDGYAATVEEMPSGLRRSLKGTSSFGDPIEIELLASNAQGVATIDLKMTNQALLPKSGEGDSIAIQPTNPN